MPCEPSSASAPSSPLGRRWRAPPPALFLADDEVHLWRASLDASPRELQRLRDILSPAELARAERLHFERDRTRFVAARGLLRLILARYRGCEPGRLQFRYGPYGKPELVAAPSGCSLCFNTSHAKGLGLYVVARGRRVGVDVELLRPTQEAEHIAKLFFSPREHAVLRSTTEDAREEAFFRLWTYKEAYLKATGAGLSRSLADVEIELATGGAARLLSVGGDAREAARWSLQGVDPAEDRIGALAVEGKHFRVACWSLQ